MTLRVNLRVQATVVAILLATLACTSSKPKSDFELDVDGDEIKVAISQEAARGILNGLLGAEFQCGGELDDHMQRLLRKLDEGGPRARASFRDGETTVEGRRHGGRLNLEISSAGSGKVEATMPWAIGQCLLGNTMTIDEATASSITVKVRNDSGRDMSFMLR